MALVFILVLGISGIFGEFSQAQNLKFPQKFLFGAGSSALQIEGAWNEDGKGESGWDYYLHHNRGIVVDNSTSDVACDSYHLYKQDVPFVKVAGMNTYRFSLSWPRILPTGDPNNVNKIAVDYYNDLINEVLSYNLTPVVTMNHFDLPLNLTKLGGWANRAVVDHFIAYAKFVLNNFGDRVKHWITVNEPNTQCLAGYGSTILSPGMNMAGISDYLCAHYTLLAHGMVYRMYKLMPDGGKMGFTVGYPFFKPYNNLNLLDYAAAELAMEFELGWVLNPVFGSGDYPQVMREQVALRSLREGRSVSRLPIFTIEEIRLLRGSADFLGVNQYTAEFATFVNICPESRNNRHSFDIDVWLCPKLNYVSTAGDFMQVVPGSLKDSLTQIREKYKNPIVLITENGFPDSPQENITYNPQRESFFQGTISDVLQSIQDGSNIMGYLVWSLLDSFEFNSGYTLKFGLVHVDFADKNKKRTAKDIANFFKNVAEYGLNVSSTVRSSEINRPDT